MVAFWIIAALLIALAALSILRPLLKRDTEASGISEQDENIANFRDQLKEFDQQMAAGQLSEADGLRLKTELEKKLLDEAEQVEVATGHTRRKTPALAWLMVLLIPVMAVPLYMKLGAQTELKVQKVLFSQETTREELQSTLEGWAKEQPDNDNALFMLGSHYMETGQLGQAIKTYRKLFRISNGHPQVAAELAQALFLQDDNEITAEVRSLYQRSLKADEKNTTALGLKGIDAFSSGDYAGAVGAWKQAMEYEPDPAARQSLGQGISKAREMLGEPGARIKLNIQLNQELASLPKAARIVVFARPAGSSQPPIIAIPLTVGELPKDLILDDSSPMMMGGAPLSTYDALDVTARISLSGDVMKADYQVEAKAVKTMGDQPVNLTFVPAG